MSAAAVVALKKQHEFWQKKMNAALEADDPEALETATNQISKLEDKAKAMNVDLNANANGSNGTASAETTTAAEAATATPTPETPSPVAKKKSKKEREAAVQERAAELAANKAANKGGAGTKAPRAKKEKTLQPCLDGCGAQVPGNFQMGHDAKLKSMILKIERGEMEMSELPEIAQELVGFKKGEKEPIMTGGKQTGTRQLYVVTKAPVRFQGRPEITFTKRN